MSGGYIRIGFVEEQYFQFGVKELTGEREREQEVRFW